jgi:hypothetical protein
MPAGLYRSKRLKPFIRDKSLRVLSLFTALLRMSFAKEEDAIYLSCPLIPGGEVSAL